MGGCHITRGALRHILNNRIYLGVIHHGSVSYPGLHDAIIDQQTFDAVQALMGVRRQERKVRPRRADSLLFADKVFDADGLPMKPVFGRSSRGRRYSYYAGPAAAPGYGDAREDDVIRRVPARVLDALVERRLTPLVDRCVEGADPDELRGLVARVEVHAARVHIVVRRQALAALTGRRGGVEWIRPRLNVSDRLVVDAVHADRLRIETPVRLKPRGGRTFAVGPNGEANVSELRADRRFIGRLRAAHRILDAAGIEPGGDVFDLRRAKAPASVASVAWAFLAPEIQRGVLTGRLNSSDLEAFSGEDEFPLCWADQLSLLATPGKQTPQAAS